MFFSKKKKEEKSNNHTKTCNHKWKDFPWYIDSTWCTDQTFNLTIIEPYVCIFCKERKNIELAMIICFFLAGITEPFLFNTSFKMSLYLFIA